VATSQDPPAPEDDKERRELACLCNSTLPRLTARGRRFREFAEVRVIRRTITGLASNHAWLYTVDELNEVSSGRTIIQIARWQTRFDIEHHPVWLNRSRYNVRSLEQWETAHTAVESYLDGSQLREDPQFIEDFAPVSKAESGVRSSSITQVKSDDGRGQEIIDLKEQVRAEQAARATESAGRRKANTWLRQVRRHVKVYRKALGEFRDLVASPTTTETQIHDSIAEANAFWLFGLDYISLDSKVPFPPKKPAFYFDLMLRRLDGFHDLVELKGPNERLFDPTTKHRGKLNKNLSEALGQVMVYLDACDRYRRTGLFKPKAVIVIGKKGTDDPRQRRLLASHLAHVEVITYSELLGRGSQLLKYLEAWKG